MDYIRENSDAILGIHCCGNTDWAMLLESGPDIINLDAFSYMEPFFLYPEAIGHFMDNGGTIAWGIVPTADYSGEETVEGLFEQFSQGVDRMKAMGIDPGLINKRSIITPACGMGSMPPEAARSSLTLLSELSNRVREVLSVS
jgi:hypothetical protein